LTLPPGNTTGPGVAVFEGISTHAHLLPYIEEQAIYEVVDFDRAYSDPRNERARMSQVASFVCPSSPDELPIGLGGRNTYYGNQGTNIIFALPGPDDPNNKDMSPPNGVFYLGSYTTIGEITD